MVLPVAPKLLLSRSRRMPRWHCVLWALFTLVTVVTTSSLSAQTSRGEFLFILQSVTKTHHAQGLENCFSFEKTDQATLDSIKLATQEILKWPNPHVFTSERSTSGPLDIKKNGKEYTLNGNWLFQVHIHKSPPPSKGFVLPVGLTPAGRYRILLAVEKPV